MLVLLSPAKTLDFEREAPPVATAAPRFAAEADAIARAAARLTQRRLRELMGISPKLAKLNADRFRGYPHAPERPAIYAFAGDVYTGLKARSLSAEATAFAQAHLRILSGLYGLLRPFDTIRPYRLEMGTRWAPGRKADLYAFWGDRIGKALAEDASAQSSGVILNLASLEYFAAVEQAPPAGLQIVRVDFRDRTPDGLRFNTFLAKQARGAMARFVCERQITEVAALAAFEDGGYRFDPEGSDAATLRFVRG